MPYRLMNILFSDRFTQEFVQLENVADWVGLDTGKARNNQLFCEGVQESFEGQNEAHDDMLFVEDEALCDFHHINFSNIVPHIWKILRVMWKILNAEYKAALSHLSWSGTHSSNFYEFYNGQHDIYHIRKHLESKPNLVSTMIADLTEDAFMESIKVVGKSPSTSNSSIN